MIPRLDLRSCLSRVNLNVVRRLVKLVLFFSLSFAVMFLISTGLRFLVLRVEWIQALTQEQETILTELIDAAHWALSLALYGSLLIGLNYTVRKRVYTPAAILCLVLLSVGFICGIDEALKSWENIIPAKTATPSLGGPGLILSNSTSSYGTVLVLLQWPDKPDGSRVIVTPGRPMLYQEEFAGRDLLVSSLPPAPFVDNTPWVLKSIAIDIKINAKILRQYLEVGLLPFLIYTGALIFLLSSFIFILKLSAWPLANLFLGCLAYRGILALEVLFNTPEMQDIFESFLQNRVPVSMAVPLIFVGVGLLAHLYSFLIFLLKRQNEYED